MRKVIVGVMGFRRLNLEWLQSLKGFCRTLLLVIEQPEDRKFEEYVDISLVGRQRLGFGKARHLLMAVCSTLDSECIIVDGDGQHPAPSIKNIMQLLAEGDSEVIIPQRTNRSLQLEVDGKALDRSEFERFETFCALDYLKKPGLPENLDMQPGMFAFKAKVAPLIFPTDDGWLADWEITLRAVSYTSFSLVNVVTNPMAQKASAFKADDQIAKFRRIQTFTGHSLTETFTKHELQLRPRERAIIKTLVGSAEKLS